MDLCGCWDDPGRVGLQGFAVGTQGWGFWDSLKGFTNNTGLDSAVSYAVFWFLMWVSAFLELCGVTSFLCKEVYGLGLGT